MSKNEHDEWPQRDSESDFDYLLRCLAEHKESHVAWAKHLEVYPPESERAACALGTAPGQWADAARYDKLIGIVTELGDLKSQWAAQKEKRMVVNLDENCIETIKRLTTTGGEEISFGGNMGGVLLRWIPTFPRTSQNQTVASGVEGAHEGTTADKKGDWFDGGTQMCCNETCPKYSPVASITCRRCRVGCYPPDPGPGSREPEKLWCPECCTESGKTEYGDCTNSFHNEPEKLNNAQKAESIMSDGQSMESKLFWLRGNLCDRHFNLYTMSSGDCPACLLLKYGSHLSGCKRLEPSSSSEIKECDCGWSKYDSVALAESSLSQNTDSSAPCSPAPLSTQPDTTTEKI